MIVAQRDHGRVDAGCWCVGGGVPEERRQGVRGAPWGRAKEGRGGGLERGWSHHGCPGAGGQDVTLGLCFGIAGLSLSEVEALGRV